MLHTYSNGLLKEHISQYDQLATKTTEDYSFPLERVEECTERVLRRHPTNSQHITDITEKLIERKRLRLDPNALHAW